jgi:hypothetical protein
MHSLKPDLVKYGLYVPRNCSGSSEKGVTTRAQGRDLKSQGENGLSHPWLSSLLIYPIFYHTRGEGRERVFDEYRGSIGRNKELFEPPSPDPSPQGRGKSRKVSHGKVS